MNKLRTREFLRHFFRMAFDKYLVFTNIASSAVLLVGGDLIQQEIEYRNKQLSKRYDYTRFGRMFIVGLAQGPMNHYFYKYLDLFIPKQDVKSVGKKIIIDQMIASPILIYSFFYGLGIMEHRTLSEIKQELNDKFLIVYIADWLVGPPAQFINFYFLHPRYRVAYINLVTLFYDVILSYVKNTDLN